MGKIQNSCFLPALIVGAVIGFLLMFFNVFDVRDHKLIAVSTLLLAMVVLIFLGKIIELKWVDLGLPPGILVGGAIAYLLIRLDLI